MTWSEIWCDVDNSKRFRSGSSRHVSQGHRLKGVAALHNFLALIFTVPAVTTWRDMSGNTRKNQVTRLVTLRHQSTMSGALEPGVAVPPVEGPGSGSCIGTPRLRPGRRAQTPGRVRRPLTGLARRLPNRCPSDPGGCPDRATTSNALCLSRRRRPHRPARVGRAVRRS